MKITNVLLLYANNENAVVLYKQPETSFNNSNSNNGPIANLFKNNFTDNNKSQTKEQKPSDIIAFLLFIMICYAVYENYKTKH